MTTRPAAIPAECVRSLARFERRFDLTATVGFLLLVFWTFSRTYFLTFLFGTPPLSILVGLYGSVVVAAAVDALQHRRLHPAFGRGGLLLLTVSTTLLFVAVTPWWIAFGTRLLS